MKLRRSLKHLLNLVLVMGLLSALAPIYTARATGVSDSIAPGSLTTTWRYTALGDSLAYGLWGTPGYVYRYDYYATIDNLVFVPVSDLGRRGWTSSDLLHALQTNQTFRSSVAASQIVTWNIGGNDLIAARSSYKNRTCGGSDNQDCLRTTVASFEANWSAIIDQVLGLRSTSNTIIRTMDIYNPFVNRDKAADTWPDDGGLNDFQVFKPYIDAVNAYIATTATGHNIPSAGVYLAFNGPNGDQDPGDKGYISFDGLHPDNAGHRVIASLLRSLGYAPLR
jgi:lysophospholipase L1-like esterase